MTKNEKDALMTYLDGQLMVLCQTLRPHVDPDAVGTLYESAYGILHDLSDTIMAERIPAPIPVKKKPR